MRKELKKINNVRNTFYGTFERYGWKSGWKVPEQTILLKDILDCNGNIVTDHLWFNFTKAFEKLGNLEPGQKIKFDARVKKYEKGYVNHREGIYNLSYDYKLSHPTKVSLND